MKAHHPQTWIEIAARTGYTARGAVYTVLGLLTLFAGIRSVEKPDTKDAISVLMHQPFGVALVFLLFAGLCCYVFWRLVQVIFDPDEQGMDIKGLTIRAALLVSAVSYTFLAIYALSLLGIVFTDGDDNGGAGLRHALAAVIGARNVALVLAITFSGVAIAHWWKAFAGTYEKYFKTDDDTSALIRPVIVTGLVARGFVFAVIAWLFASRFFYLTEEDGGKNPGLQDVLTYLSKQPYGLWLTIGMGLGLLSFAFYSFAEARWRRIRRP